MAFCFTPFELLDIILMDIDDSFNNAEIFPTYLKMKNPSSGDIHIEGVPAEIKSCQEALLWRIGGKKWNPAQLS